MALRKRAVWFNWVRHLMRWCGAELVWTQDTDGDIRLRIVWRDLETGSRYVNGLDGWSNILKMVRLKDGGRVERVGEQSPTYVCFWYALDDCPIKPKNSPKLTWRVGKVDRVKFRLLKGESL